MSSNFHGDQTEATSRPGRPASIAPSISSVMSDATTITAPIHEQRGFKSREAYLAALNEFAESKLYMPAGDHTLHGWYGEKTMDDYKNRPGLRDDRKKKSKRAKSLAKLDHESQSTMNIIHEASEGPNQVTTSDQSRDTNDETVAERTEHQGRLRRLSRVLHVGKERRATVV